MAVVWGTGGNDFMHLAGDGRTAPPGYIDITFNPGDLIAADSGDDILIGTAAGNRFGGYDGYDILDYSDFTQGVVISELDGGIRFFDGTVIGTIAASAGIEEFQGTAFDDVLATAPGGSAVKLVGNAGNDTLNANSNVELLDGGADNDTVNYSNSTAGVTVDLNLSVQVSGGHASGDTLVNIENVTGSGHDDTLTGDGGNNVLAGLAGADALIGGPGSDTADHTASTAGIIISLQAGTAAGGHAEGDTLTGIENLTGSAFDDMLTGTDADLNVLNGGAGNDVLDGLGGNDMLIGGAGDDIYYVDAAGDQAVELADAGADVVRAYLDWTLGDNIERLELQGTDALSGTGNALDNIILGNAGSNLLVGGAGDDLLNGSAGADTAEGGIGNDRYYVDDAGDIIVENSAEGTADRVYAAVSYQLAAGAEVEILNARTPAATTAINLTGNVFGQTIIGNAGANIIDGQGGIDTMKGLGGNDIYHVDNSGDIVIEKSTEGTADQVMTSVDYTLGRGVGIEILSTTDATGTAAIQLAGNSYANTIIGNAGNNVINGGAGADRLSGLGGNDTFVFDTALGSPNVDTITDFNVVDDTIQLEATIFAAIAGTGTLSAAQFVMNLTGLAEDSSNRVIYETDTGKLLYDANGSAAGGRLHFATLDKDLALTANDFFIV